MNKTDNTIEKQIKNERRVEVYAFIVAVVCICVGIMFALFNYINHELIMLLLGALFILSGSVHIIGYMLHLTLRPSNRFDFSFGVFNVIAGGLVLFMSQKLVAHFSVIVGLMLMFKAVTWLQTALELKDVDGKRFHKETVYSCLLFGLGLVFVLVEFEMQHIGTIYHGFALIAEGGVEVYSVIERKIREKKEVAMAEEDVVEQCPT